MINATPLANGRPDRHARRGMLLVVVLAVISVLALLGASFSYMMNARFASVRALQDQQQATVAVRTAIDRVAVMLRSGRVDMTNWYNNPQAFRRIPVYLPDQGDRDGEGKGGSESLADQEKIDGRNVWRFSLVACEPGKDESQRPKIRYGITDEASKVNLNVATRSQLIALFDTIRHDKVSSTELADALIDWRDSDDTQSAEGAESSYYLKLKPGFRAKNGPLSSIEELLMVKGFNGRIVYGEDYNRNGYMDDNENDGEDGTFPPDDGDGKLNRGLLSYVTIYSWDWNRSNDNRMRVDINTIQFSQIASGALQGNDSGDGKSGDTGSKSGDASGNAMAGLAAMLSKVPQPVAEELPQAVVDFIADAQKRGYRFKSVGDLLGLEIKSDGTSNHDKMWRKYAKDFRQAEQQLDEAAAQTQPSDLEDADSEDTENEDVGQGTGHQDAGNRTTGNRGAGASRGSDRNSSGDKAQGRTNTGNSANNSNNSTGNRSNDSNRTSGGKKDSRRMQSVRSARKPPPGISENRGPGNLTDPNAPPPTSDHGDLEPAPPRDEEDRTESDTENETARDEHAPADDNSADPDQPRHDADEGDMEDQTGNDGSNGSGGNAQGGASGNVLVSPVEPADMAVLCDRLTVWSAPVMAGLINVNTAPAAVLKTIPGLTAEDAESIVDKRQSLQSTDKLTPAWLVTSGAITPETFALISNLVTTRSIQFTIDAVGFADHVGTVKRVQAVVEMRGELAQLKYYRDITSVGVGFPVWDDQRSDGFAFSDR